MQRLRINRKDAYVTADFVMPKARWKSVPQDAINSYLAEGMLQTLQAMCDHLRKLKIEVNSGELMEDANKAVAAFIAKNLNTRLSVVI